MRKFISKFWLSAFAASLLFVMITSLPSASSLAPRQAITTTNCIPGTTQCITRTFTQTGTGTIVILVPTTVTTTTSITQTVTSTSFATTISTESVSIITKLTETTTTTSTTAAGLVPGLDPSLNIMFLILSLMLGVVIGGMVVWGKFHRAPSPAPKGRVTDYQALRFCSVCGKPAPNDVCSGCSLPNLQCNCPKPKILREGERMCTKCGLFKIVSVNCAGCGKLESTCVCMTPTGREPGPDPLKGLNISKGCRPDRGAE